MVAVVLVAGVFVTSIVTVWSFLGSTVAIMVGYIMPAYMYLKVPFERQFNADSCQFNADSCHFNADSRRFNADSRRFNADSCHFNADSRRFNLHLKIRDPDDVTATFVQDVRPSLSHSASGNAIRYHSNPISTPF